MKFTAYISSTIWFLNYYQSISCQSGGDQEFDPYVYRAHHVPYKNTQYATDWWGSDVAYLQGPLLAAAKPTKFHTPVKLPTIAPYVVKWSELNNVAVNEENTWNFEKRIDRKVWWPNK
uniref:Secreted protein n=1 Tax=Rhabditophanes sp. KR3021 TaxID=114890 RepID=A0AC35U6K9_9BILA